MRDVGHEIPSHLIGPAQIGDVVEHQDRAAAPLARDRHDVRREGMPPIAIEVDFGRGRLAAAKRTGELARDVGGLENTAVICLFREAALRVLAG